MFILKPITLSILVIFIISGSLMAQSKTVSDSEIQFKKLLVQGIEISERGEYTKALEYLKKAETLTENVQSKSDLCSLKIYLGNVYGFLSNYGAAMGYYKQALSLARKLNSNDQVAIILNNIGWLYTIDNNFQVALKNYEDAYEVTRKNKVTDYTKSRIAVNIADIYNKLGDFEKSQKYLLEVENADTTEEIKQMWKANYAESLLLGGQADKAEKIATGLLKEAHVKCYTCVTALLVKIYQKQNKKDLAVFYARKGLNHTSSYWDKLELYNHLSKIYADAGDCSLAFKYKDSVMVAKDSMNARINRGLYESNKVKFKVQEYQNELQVNQSRQAAERKLYIISIVFGIAFLFVMYRWLKNKQKQERKLAENKQKIVDLELENLKNNVAEKNRKLSAKALYLSGRNELIEEVMNALSNIPEVTGNKQVLDYMKTLKSYLKSDAEWDEFITYFEQANPNFLKTLSARHPQLNSADIRFICYVLMNLDIREISTIFNITINAATKRKRRIKEKMGIDKDDSLYEYLTKMF